MSQRFGRLPDGRSGASHRRRVTELPRLADATPEAAQRFVNLVDVLHDADVCLNIVARHPLREVMTGTRLPPDVGRAASRLTLLRLKAADDPDEAATS